MEILPYLYLGRTEKADITISMIPGDTTATYNVPIFDEPGKQLIGPAARVHKLINLHKSDKIIAVYCRHCQNRSVATIIWHLLWSKLPLNLILKKVQWGDINIGFRREIMRYKSTRDV